MKIVRTIREVRRLVADARAAGARIGLVPTMGYLHQGHRALVERARRECGYVVTSIFVNPTQFLPGEDFAAYPRDLRRDARLLRSAGVDVLFHPGVAEMYPGPAGGAAVSVRGLDAVLEGRWRPGHFTGVCTVVLKLFNIVAPDTAFFGWKDAQQFIIIRTMAADLNLPVRVVGVPTVREPDGLAASSRNIYLSPVQRRSAVCLARGLRRMREMVKSEGVRDARRLLAAGRQEITGTAGVELQYLAVVSTENLQPVRRAGPGTMAAGAVKIGRVRLIDNIRFDRTER